MNNLELIEPPVRSKWAIIPDRVSHPHEPPEILFYGAHDMSRLEICFLGIGAYHIFSHVKSLSWHKISGGSVPAEWWLTLHWTGGSAASEYTLQMNLTE